MDRQIESKVYDFLQIISSFPPFSTENSLLFPLKININMMLKLMKLITEQKITIILKFSTIKIIDKKIDYYWNLRIIKEQEDIALNSLKIQK